MIKITFMEEMFQKRCRKASVARFVFIDHRNVVLKIIECKGFELFGFPVSVRYVPDNLFRFEPFVKGLVSRGNKKGSHPCEPFEGAVGTSISATAFFV